jgi:hypothetical protein
MKISVFLFFVLFSKISSATSCWDEARAKSKQDFDRIREFQENRPIQPTDYSNTVEVESYQKAVQEHRDKVKAMQNEASEKGKQYSEECKVSSAQKFSAEQAKSNDCLAGKSSQVKANWDQLAELEKSRPSVPLNLKNQEVFEAYKKSRDIFESKYNQLKTDIKAKNQMIIDSPFN